MTEPPNENYVKCHDDEPIDRATARDLDKLCRKGCNDPNCDLTPEQHWGMGIEPQCHETNRIAGFYDSRTKALYLHCGVCGKPIFSVRIQ